jgi:hypothetical protein
LGVRVNGFPPEIEGPVLAIAGSRT